MKKTLLSPLALALLSLVIVSPAFAQTTTTTAPNYTTLLSAVDWSTTSAAILSIGAGLMTLYILMKGVKILHRFIKGS